jgi:hypothetical protein
MLLASTAGRLALGAWPQYASSIVPDAAGRPAVHLGVLQYFLFWFVFYAVKGGDLSSAFDPLPRGQPAGFGDSVRKVRRPTTRCSGQHRAAVQSTTRSGRGSSCAGRVYQPASPHRRHCRCMQAADVLHLTRGREGDMYRQPYLSVLRTLLRELLPRPAGAGQLTVSPSKAGERTFRRRRPARLYLLGSWAAASAAALCRPDCGRPRPPAVPTVAAPSAPAYLRPAAGGGTAGAAGRGLLLLSILVEFWLTDASEPVPVAVQGAPLAGSGMGALW